MNSKTLWIIITIVLIISLIFVWRNHVSTQEMLMQAQETIKATQEALRESKDALQKIDKITQDIKDITRIAKEAGDELAKEIQSVSDDDFLNAANDYSTIVVERME